MKSLLFICWDGPQVNYLEGLFLPILERLKEAYAVHVIQFTWGDPRASDRISGLFEAAGVRYNRYTISRRPQVTVGTIKTLVAGTGYLKRYVSDNKIDILMPRSTFPALMVLGMGKALDGRKLVFDADGLPLEERVDFAGLNPRGLQYRFLKRKERQVIHRADRVLVRTRAAIPILTGSCGSANFFVVSNGRSPTRFLPLDPDERLRVRKELGFAQDDLVLVYCGSMGPQYCVNEMLLLPGLAAAHGIECKLLVLTGSPERINDTSVITRSLSSAEVPRYLGAADIGLALRVPFPSMAGVAPIKLGEYLLCGLPVLASGGIGDTGTLLAGSEACHLLDDHSPAALDGAVRWIGAVVGKPGMGETARSLGLRYFSLEESVASYQEALKNL